MDGPSRRGLPRTQSYSFLSGLFLFCFVTWYIVKCGNHSDVQVLLPVEREYGAAGPGDDAPEEDAEHDDVPHEDRDAVQRVHQSEDPTAKRHRHDVAVTL